MQALVIDTTLRHLTPDSVPFQFAMLLPRYDCFAIRDGCLSVYAYDLNFLSHFLRKIY